MTAWRSLIPTWEILTISFWEGLLKIPLPVLLSWAYFNFPFIFEGQFLVNIKSPVDSLFLAVFWRCHTLLSAFQGCWWEASCWSNGKIPVYDRWLLCCCSQNYLFVFVSLTVMCWGLTPLSLSYLESVPFLRCIDHFHKWSECQDIISSFFSGFLYLPFLPSSLIMFVWFTGLCWFVHFWLLLFLFCSQKPQFQLNYFQIQGFSLLLLRPSTELVANCYPLQHLHVSLAFKNNF